MGGSIAGGGVGVDGIDLCHIHGDGDLDIVSTDENVGPGSRGLGVVWYEDGVIRA